jgi:hypothetical protein
MPSEILLDRLVMAYRINDRILQEIQVDAWLHPTAVPEEILVDMALLYAEMTELIPQSHLLAIYGL